MITCPVCGQQNDDFSVVCISCKSYLQSKVDNLNLFETIWMLMESPRGAFRKIVLARHKNYVTMLSGLLGVSLAFSFFWLKNLGDSFDNLLVLAGTAVLTGIPAGLVTVRIMGFIIARGIRLLRGKATARNSAAVVAYASIPIVFSLILVLPLEVAIFGLDFFGTNPPPLVVNTGVYISLLAFDALAALWTVLLLYKGIATLAGFGQLKSIVLTAMSVGIAGGLSLGLKYL